MSSLERVLEWRGRDAVDPDGDKIGSIEEIYVDQETDEPEWALVNTGLFGARSTFVPLSAATEEGGSIRLPFAKAHVKDAPGIDPSGELTRDEEARLYSHYDIDYDRSRSQTGLPEGEPGRGDRDPDSGPDLRDRAETRGVARSERDSGADRPDGERGSGSGERLRVADDRSQPARPRLRRYVVTEVVTASGTQEVEREQVSEVELPDEDSSSRS